MKLAAFYLAAIALHLVVLFGLGAPFAKFITPKPEKKFLVVTLIAPPPAPASPLPTSAPPPPGPPAAPPVVDTPPPPPPPVMDIPPPEPTPPVPPPPQPSPLPPATPTAPAAPSAPVSSATAVGALSSPNGVASPVSAGGTTGGLHSGTITQWSVFSGGNGHYYEAVCVPGGIIWADAQKYAVTRGGYLATINSKEENAFVFSLIDDPDFWYNSPRIDVAIGPWLGGFKSASSTRPDAGWQWVHGEGAFTYTNWSVRQPDNAGGTQTRLSFYAWKHDDREPTWDDTHEATACHGFIVEYDSDPLKLPYNPNASLNVVDSYSPPKSSYSKH